LTHLQQSLKSVRFYAGCLGPSAQAVRAKHFIFMLGDALPAEKPAALRTAGRRFPQHVVVTTLVSKILYRHINSYFEFVSDFVFRASNLL
jgi:hypothetical protein